MNDLQISNYALTLLGADTISALTASEENARKVSASYTYILNAMIKEHPWNFAIKRATLSSSSSTPVYGYSYYHDIPSDSLRILSIYNGTDEDDDIEDYKVEGSYIASDESTLYARYIYLPSTSSLSLDFAMAFATRLAAELTWAITNSADMVQNMYNLYQEKLRIAKNNDTQESGKTETFGEDEWIEARV